MLYYSSSDDRQFSMMFTMRAKSMHHRPPLDLGYTSILLLILILILILIIIIIIIKLPLREAAAGG